MGARDKKEKIKNLEKGKKNEFEEKYTISGKRYKP
jgi:hypothetical protein